MPKRRKVTRIWTKTVVCLADKESSRVPSSAEKEILFKAGLGTRKIQFLTSEADVLKTIIRLNVLSINPEKKTYHNLSEKVKASPNL